MLTLLAAQEILKPLPLRILSLQQLLGQLSSQLLFQVSLFDHLDCLELVGVVSTKEELDVFFVSTTYRSYRTGRALLLLLLVSLFVVILNLLTVGNEGTDLLIQVINDDTRLLVLNLVYAPLKPQGTRNIDVWSFLQRRLSIQVKIYMFFRGWMTMRIFWLHVDKILEVFGFSHS